jgi:ornithine cyclodeaminase
MALLLTDRDLETVLPMSDALATVEGALRERANGTAVAVPRTRFDVGDSSLVFTPGGYRELGVMGLRVYATGVSVDHQLVAIWETVRGQLLCLIVGSALGAIRTGAIGGIAVKCLARSDAEVVGVVGAGRQARTQLLAIQQVRPIRKVLIYRRDAHRREEVAQSLRTELGIPVEVARTAEEVVRPADIVILATTSSSPVIESSWLKPGVHVNTLGPKYRSRSEIGIDLIERADWLASDFPEQYQAEPEFILHGTSQLSRIEDLAQVLISERERPRGITTVFLSHGLAGTEVAVAKAAYLNALRRRIGHEVTG